MYYQKDQIIPLEVLPSSKESEFMEFNAPDADNNPTTIQLPKLQFQKEPDYVLPATVDCRVVNVQNGVPAFTQYIPSFIYQFYRDTHLAGQSIECTVIFSPLDKTKDKFRVMDSYGLIFNISDRNAMLQKGQKVSCRFQSLSKQGCILKFDNDNTRLPFYSPKQVQSKVYIKQYLLRYIRLLWNRAPEFEYLRNDLENRNPLWFINMMRDTLTRFPWGLTAEQLKKRNLEVRQIIMALRRGALYFLEESSFLNALNFEYRKSLQAQITELVESLQPYDKFLKLMGDDTQDEFVASLFDKLEKSGYLYHPHHTFGVLMMIFRLYPHKVSKYLSNIFQSIFLREIENWEREPFRTAFVEQFEMYLRQAAASIDGLPMAESKSQKDKLLTAITATALKILLAKPGTDLHRTYSTYYRYISLLSPTHNESLLNQSLQTLLGCKPLNEPVYSQLKNPMYIVASAAAAKSGDPLKRIQGNHRFCSGNAELEISSQGISLTHVGRSRDTEQTIPSLLMPWLHPEVRLNGVKSLSGTKIKRMGDHNGWWTEMEHGFFKDEQDYQEKTVTRFISKAEIDDTVTIVIDSMEDDPDNQGFQRFFCHIDDEDFEEGYGYMDRADIVGYRTKNLDESCFRRNDGTPLRFRVKVADIADDGTYHFSMEEFVHDYVRDNFDVQSNYKAVVTNTAINKVNRSYSALTDNGFGLFLEPAPHLDIENSDIVSVKLYSVSGDVIQGYITEKLDRYADSFSTAVALRNLMHNISIDGPEESEDEIDEMVYDEMMPEDVHELIEIIRYRAISEKNLLNAYDYLRFARLLALMTDDMDLADSLGAHAALLLQHDFYATNKRIDPQNLESLRQDSTKVPLLNRLFNRLKMVSWLGDDSHNDTLYGVVNNPDSTELERTIARLVLSHNMMLAVSDNSDSICNNLKKEIGDALDVISDTRLGKYYGSESKFIEFKTSIVYPAVARGQRTYPDPEAQTEHIMSRITGFLNAEGGTLFLGVNNEGYAAGLADDFEYFKTHTLSAGAHTHKITDADKLQVYIDGLLSDSFGPAAKNKIAVSIDDDELNREKGRVVIRFDIQKSLTPVYYKNRLYVRQSGQSTKYYTGEDEKEFLLDRENSLAEMRLKAQMAAKQASLMESEKEAAREAQASAKSASTDHGADNNSDNNSDNADPRVRTSAWRPNVLHEYEEGFSEPSGYLYFTADACLEFSPDDQYKEEDCLLTLAIPHDMENASLIMGYENAEPLKIPLAEIYEKGTKVPIRYSLSAPLVFAALASDHEGVLSVVADNSSNLFYRVEPVSEIQQGHINTDPASALTSSLNHVLAMDLVSEAAMPSFSAALKSQLKRKALGLTMRTNESKNDYKQKIDELVASCHI